MEYDWENNFISLLCSSFKPISKFLGGSSFPATKIKQTNTHEFWAHRFVPKHSFISGFNMSKPREGGEALGISIKWDVLSEVRLA